MKSVKYIGYISFICFLFYTSILPAYSANVTPLLTKAFDASKYAYEGVQSTMLALSSGNVSSQVKVISDGHGNERRIYQSGAMKGVETLQVNGKMWRRSTSGRWMEIPLNEDRRSVQAIVQDIQRNYTVTIKPTVNMIGRKAIPVWIEATNNYNPSRRIWMDSATGIILKDSLYSPDGSLRSVSSFSSLKIARIPSVSLKPPPKYDFPALFGPSSFLPRKSAQAVIDETNMDIHLPDDVPNGYHPVMYGVMITGSGRKMPVVRYSDGLGSFTIFQRGMGGGFGFGGGNGRRMRGAGGQGTCMGNSDTQHAIVTYMGVKGNYILIGDIAETELKRIAVSLP